MLEVSPRFSQQSGRTLRSGNMSAGYREKQGHSSGGLYKHASYAQDGTLAMKREAFHREGLCTFRLDRVVKSGQRFNPDKARWFNRLYLRRESSHRDLAKSLAQMAPCFNLIISANFWKSIVGMMIERVSFLGDIFESKWLFYSPSEENFNLKLVKKKWKDEVCFLYGRPEKSA